MLIYEKEVKKPLKRYIEEATNPVEFTEDTKESIGEVYFDANKEGYYTFTDFYDIKPVVPADLLNLVRKDNMSYLFDRQIYSAEFFEFANEIVVELHAMLGSLEEKCEKNLATISIKSLFIIMARTSYNKIINTLADNFIKLLRESRVVLEELLDYLVKDFDTEVMPILTHCPYKPIRQAIETVVSNALLIEFNKPRTDPNSDAELNPQNAKAIQVLDLMMRKIDSKLAKDCSRFEQFFQILEAIAKHSGNSVKHYMNSKDLITTLLDFYLESESPFYNKRKPRDKMETKNLKPSFDSLIESACTLALNGDLTFKQPLDAKARACLGVSEALYELSGDAQRVLTAGAFVSKTIVKSYSTASFGKLIGLFCYENEKYSKSVVKLILKGINANPAQSFSRYFIVIEQILLITDSLQTQRLEWIFGLAFMAHGIRQSQVRLKSYEYIKIALTLINSIKERINDYLTPLSYKGLYNSLLGLLFVERHNLDINPINSLLSLMLKNKAVFAYVLSLPPPTYQFGKLFDWIKVFIENYSPASNHVRENPEYNETVKRLGEIAERAAANSAGSGDAYVVGRIVGENYILKSKKDNALVFVSELVTECFESHPNGASNQAIPADYFKARDSQKAGAPARVEPSVLKVEVSNRTPPRNPSNLRNSEGESEDEGRAGGELLRSGRHADECSKSQQEDNTLHVPETHIGEALGTL